jgi:hypothetical protein
MENALIALVGVLAGILLNEHFRKRNQIEFYSQKIFDKHLKVHETLFSHYRTSYNLISEIMKNQELSLDQYREIFSAAFMPLCEYLDNNHFYLSEELRVQVFTSFADAQDFPKIEDQKEKEKLIELIRETYKTTTKIIIEESGVSEISKHFRTVSKSSPDSPIIRYMKKLKK